MLTPANYWLGFNSPTQSDPVAHEPHSTVHVVTASGIINTIAVAGIEAALAAIPPDRVLDEPGESPWKGRVELPCVEVCPVDCFYEGENMLVIHPEECIDCGVCEPECPVDAIKPDTEPGPGLEKWLSLNAEYAKIWPNITIKKAPPPDSEEWEGKPDKLQYFSPNPGAGD